MGKTPSFSCYVRMENIRKATPDDIPGLVEMGERMWAATPYASLIAKNTEQMRTLLLQLMGGSGAVLVAEHGKQIVGMLGMVVFSHPISAELTGGELFWWVEPEARGVGVSLLRAGQRFAEDAGAVKMQMVAPTQDVERLYSKLGYSKVETTYQRELR